MTLDDYERRREIERLAATMPAETVEAATRLFGEAFNGDRVTEAEVRHEAAEFVAPLLAAEFRRQAWAMCKGYDPSGADYRATVRAATRLFDAAERLDGQRDPDEPDEYAEREPDRAYLHGVKVTTFGPGALYDAVFVEAADSTGESGENE